LIGAGFGGEFDGGLAHFPSSETAFAVFGEIFVADRLAFELSIENRLNLGERVQPGQDEVGGFCVGEALVELIADGLGETGDFAGHGGASGFRFQGSEGRVSKLSVIELSVISHQSVSRWVRISASGL
jgi:hypothetical protein